MSDAAENICGQVLWARPHFSGVDLLGETKSYPKAGVPFTERRFPTGPSATGGVGTAHQRRAGALRSGGGGAGRA